MMYPMSNPVTIPDEARAALDASVGLGFDLEARPGRSHSSALVFRVCGPLGTVFLKLHREPRRYEQERFFYQNLAEILGSAVPRLVGEAPRGLVLSLLEGEPVNTLAEGTDLKARAFHEAGAFLARLHALFVEDTDALSVSNALSARVAALRRDAGGSELRVALARLEASLPELAGAALSRSFCHRDFQPDNWLFDPRERGALGVLDFEHSRSDLSLFDLSRVDLLHLSRSPALAEAFWDGYGGPPAGEARALYEAVKCMDAARTTIWAQRHQDPVFQKEAEIMWRALRI